MKELQGHQLETLLLETLDDLTHQAPLHAIGLHHDVYKGRGEGNTIMEREKTRSQKSANKTAIHCLGSLLMVVMKHLMNLVVVLAAQRV